MRSRNMALVYHAALPNAIKVEQMPPLVVPDIAMTRIVLLHLIAAGLAFAQDGHPKIDPSRIVKYEREEVAVPDFPASGLILDIGGGGEGVVGQLMGARRCAQDGDESHRHEIRRWQLSHRASFFTLLYVPVDQ